jgi:Bacteriophage clamp loader A subunit
MDANLEFGNKMQLSDFLRAINQTKQDVIRESDSPDAAAKVYSQFVIARSLSYFPETVHLVNEINRYNVDNLQHYDFMMNLIPKGKRFAKWVKPEKSDIIKKLVDLQKISYDKAKEIARILTDDQLAELTKEPDYGGQLKGK